VARIKPEFGRGNRSYLAHRVDANGEVRMVWRLNCMSRALIIWRSLLDGIDQRVFVSVADSGGTSTCSFDHND